MDFISRLVMERKEKIRNREKLTDWKALWESFINPEPQIENQEEFLLKNANVVDTEALMKALNNCEKLANKMFKEQYKVTNVKNKKGVNEKKTKQVAKMKELEDIKASREDGKQLKKREDKEKNDIKDDERI